MVSEERHTRLRYTLAATTRTMQTINGSSVSRMNVLAVKNWLTNPIPMYCGKGKVNSAALIKIWVAQTEEIESLDLHMKKLCMSL